MRRTLAALALGFVVLLGCSRSPTTSASTEAGAPLVAVRALRIASEVRWSASGEVVFLVERGADAPAADRVAKPNELVAWTFDSGGLRSLGVAAADVDKAMVSLGVAVSTPPSANALALVVNDRFAAVTASGHEIRIEGHGDAASTGGVKPSATTRADGLFVALGTENEIVVVRASDALVTTLVGSENRELAHFVEQAHSGGPVVGSHFVVPETGLRWRAGTLVCGPIAIAADHVGFATWPHVQHRFLPSSPAGPIVLADEPKRILIPSAADPRIVVLPVTTTSIARYADARPDSLDERRLGVDADAHRIAWFSRATKTKRWAVRNVAIAPDATSPVEVEVDVGPIPLFARGTSEEAFNGPDAPVFRPGKNAVFVTVPARGAGFASELVQIDFASRETTRYPGVVRVIAVAPEGGFVLASAASAPSLLDVEHGKAIALPSCGALAPSASGPAAFSQDGRWVYAALDRRPWAVGRFRVGENPACDGVVSARATGAANVLAIATMPRALAILDDDGLGLYDPIVGTPLADLELAETWLAARFADGAIEIWGDEQKASSALFCSSSAGHFAKFDLCEKASRARDRLNVLLAP